jgi:hypothetical protein
MKQIYKISLILLVALMAAGFVLVFAGCSNPLYSAVNDGTATDEYGTGGNEAGTSGGQEDSGTTGLHITIPRIAPWLSELFRESASEQTRAVHYTMCPA